MSYHAHGAKTRSNFKSLALTVDRKLCEGEVEMTEKVSNLKPRGWCNVAILQWLGLAASPSKRLNDGSQACVTERRGVIPVDSRS
jgi:hypothetical protein